MVGRLEGKVAIVTGAARGQGAAAVDLFRAEGCCVMATDIDEAALLAGPERESVRRLRHDVADQAGWDAIVAATLGAFGRLDVLLNNAAAFVPRSFAETSVEDLDLHYWINQRGAFLGMQAALGPMRAAGGGSIVNVSSVAGARGSAGAFAYAASKWAIRGMTKCSALDLASTGIRVNAILPGLIDTAMMRRNPPERNAAIISAIPLGRPGLAGEVAAAALYLASDAAAYLTGSEITVDGGISA